MKRKPERLAAAGMTALCALNLMPTGALTAAAFQPSAAVSVRRADAKESAWKDDGRHYQVTTQNDPLNMRAAPDQFAQIITTIPKSTVVTVLQTRDGWGKVQYGTVVGYCSMNWLTLVPDTAAAPAPENNAENDPVANEKRIYQYLTGTLNLSSAAACGIIGNIHVETGGTFDPTANNLDAPEGPYGYGLCQWNSGEAAGYRMEELQTYTTAWKTLDGQLDFIRYDLLHNSYLISRNLYDDLKALGNTEADAVKASDIWAVVYEGCAEWTYEPRREKAKLYFREHSGKPMQWSVVSRTYTVTTESGELNMRSEPSVLSSIILTIPKDADVFVKSISDDGLWAQVEYKGRNGYCTTQYLKEKAGSAAAVVLIRGDLNGNGAVSAEDAQITLVAYTDSITGKKMNLTDAQRKAADVDSDGQVTVKDAQLILMYYTAKYVALKNITWEQILSQ